MYEFLDKLADELDKLGLFTPIVVDNLNAGDAIAIRTMPSNRGVSFYDKQRVINGMFQLLVKHSNQGTAISTIERVAEYIETTEIELDGFRIVNLEIYVEPHYLSGNSQEKWLYNAAFAVELTKE